MSDPAISLPARRVPLGIVLAGLVLMFFSAAGYLVEHPSLTVHSQVQEAAAPTGADAPTAAAPPAGMPGAGMPEGVIEFMRRLQIGRAHV